MRKNKKKSIFSKTPQCPILSFWILNIHIIICQFQKRSTKKHFFLSQSMFLPLVILWWFLGNLKSAKHLYFTNIILQILGICVVWRSNKHFRFWYQTSKYDIFIFIWRILHQLQQFYVVNSLPFLPLRSPGIEYWRICFRGCIIDFWKGLPTERKIITWTSNRFNGIT